MNPIASVIIAGYYSTDTLGITLDSLQKQSSTDFETIVVNSSPEADTEKLIRDKYPWVKFYQHPQRLLMHAARNKGVELSRGNLLIFTDPDLRIHPQWIEKFIQAHENGAKCMVAEMDCLSSDWLSMGIHLVKFHPHLPGCKYTVNIAPTAAAAYDAALFKKFGGFEGDKVCGDAIASWHVYKFGEKIERVPGIPVYHIHNHTLKKLITERKNRGQEFMRERIKFEQWSRNKARTLILLFPLLVLYVCAIVGRNAWSAGWLTRFLYTFPVQLIGQACWCWGECLAQINFLRGKM